MKNFEQYQNMMNNIGFQVDFENYLHFIYYESMWLNYIYDIFLPNQNVLKERFARLIIMESCPAGAFPHPNYIFDNINHKLTHPADRYLQQVYAAFYNQNDWKNISKCDALIQLAHQNVILLDILPSHGFGLDDNVRKIINNNQISCCHFSKLNLIKAHFPSNEIEWRTVYSMPPTHNTSGINNLLNTPNAPSYFGSMTAGSGFPSINLLKDIIISGF